MTLVLFTLGLLAVLVGLMVVTARLFRDYPASELLDWKPTRSPEVEAQNEVDDVQQMIDAQNEYRRRRGAKEITEADVERHVREDEAMRARGRGPLAQGGGLDDASSEPPPAGPKRRPRKEARRGKPTTGPRGTTKKRA
jgi:hypothetical protein